MRTKYKKVAVSDRLPKKFGYYLTFNVENQQGYRYFEDTTNSFRSEYEIEFWLEEVQDYEYEMMEELKHLVRALKTVSSFGATASIIEHAENLIKEATELK